MSWQEIYKWYSGTHGAPVSGEASGVKMGKDHQEGNWTTSWTQAPSGTL